MKETVNSKASRNITSMDISKLKPFFKHIFSVRDDNRIQKLFDIIKANGVIELIIVRRINEKEFKYEIVAGHSRMRGAKILGLTSIPCDIGDIPYRYPTILFPASPWAFFFLYYNIYIIS